MKKLLLSTLTLVLIFSLAGWATETRVMTLGKANNIVKDNANVFLYPSTINFYRNIVVAEVCGSEEMYVGAEFWRFGAHYDFGEDKGVVGLYFDQYGLDLSEYQPDPCMGMNPGNGMIDNKLDLIYGRPFGETYFGFALSLYSDSFVSEAEGDDTEEKNMALGVQLGLTTMEEKLDVAAGLLYGPTWTNVGSDGEDVNEPESNMGLMVGGRYWYEFNDEVMFVPHLGFTYDMFGVKDSFKYNMMELDLGWGVNIMPADMVLLLFDFGIKYQTAKVEPEEGDESTKTNMNLPYFKGGLEGNVTDWWDVRFGAVKYWMSESTEDWYEDEEPLNYKSGWAETSLYIGSGLHFGNLDIDVWMDPAFALNGPYFVSGNATMMAYQASLTYNIP